MKFSKTFKFGTSTFKTYCKPAGYGYETGILFNQEPVFVGNFVHKAEAYEWMKQMYSAIGAFFDAYTYYPNVSDRFYRKFFANYMYTTYYAYLDKKFSKYKGQYAKATKYDTQTYKKYKTSYFKEAAV